jgi:hypothetical protein
MKNKLRALIFLGAAAIAECGQAQILTVTIPETAVPTVIVDTQAESIASITLLGSDEKVEWTQTAEALTVKAPTKSPNNIAIVFKLTL